MILDDCPICGKNFWDKREGEKFLVCVNCNPKEKKSDEQLQVAIVQQPRLVVQPIASGRVTLTETITLTLCRPWCTHCGCWMARESTWSDGRTESRCWTCRRPVPEWPDASDEPKKDDKECK